MASDRARTALSAAQVAALGGKLDEWTALVADITEAAVKPWRERVQQAEEHAGIARAQLAALSIDYDALLGRAQAAERKLATIAANARTLAPEDILRIIGDTK